MPTTLLLTEDISEPIDEGIKSFSYHLANYIDVNDNRVYCRFPNKNIHNRGELPTNKFFFSFSFFKDIKLQKPQLILYVPDSSSTLMSFIRLKIIALICRSASIVMVSVQSRNHNSITKILISTFFKPSNIVVLSKREALYYGKMGIKSVIISSGVDAKKFNSILANEKNKLRQKLGLPINGRIALHVGHINKGRNLAMLKELISLGYRLIVIGSTRFESDIKYQQGLEKEGFTFLNHYIEKIEEYFQASDIYVFPVMSNHSSIGFPLSVLEAMSCNIPVLTTRFGGLQYSFSESESFKYFNTKYELLEKAELLSNLKKCNNREMVLKDYSWEIVFNDLLAKLS